MKVKLNAKLTGVTEVKVVSVNAENKEVVLRLNKSIELTGAIVEGTPEEFSAVIDVKGVLSPDGTLTAKKASLGEKAKSGSNTRTVEVNYR